MLFKCCLIRQRHVQPPAYSLLLLRQTNSPNLQKHYSCLGVWMKEIKFVLQVCFLFPSLMNKDPRYVESFTRGQVLYFPNLTRGHKIYIATKRIRSSWSDPEDWLNGAPMADPEPAWDAPYGQMFVTRWPSHPCHLGEWLWGWIH